MSDLLSVRELFKSISWEEAEIEKIFFLNEQFSFQVASMVGTDFRTFIKHDLYNIRAIGVTYLHVDCSPYIKQSYAPKINYISFDVKNKIDDINKSFSFEGLTKSDLLNCGANYSLISGEFLADSVELEKIGTIGSEFRLITNKDYI
jgi:hypothetical protein